MPVASDEALKQFERGVVMLSLDTSRVSPKPASARRGSWSVPWRFVEAKVRKTVEWPACRGNGRIQFAAVLKRHTLFGTAGPLWSSSVKRARSRKSAFMEA